MNQDNRIVGVAAFSMRINLHVPTQQLQCEVRVRKKLLQDASVRVRRMCAGTERKTLTKSTAAKFLFANFICGRQKCCFCCRFMYHVNRVRRNNSPFALHTDEIFLWFCMLTPAVSCSLVFIFLFVSFFLLLVCGSTAPTCLTRLYSAIISSSLAIIYFHISSWPHQLRKYVMRWEFELVNASPPTRKPNKWIFIVLIK